jgi:phosphate/sulfate permease
VDRLFRRLQLVSAAAFSLGHGGNDAQKTMGIISAPTTPPVGPTVTVEDGQLFLLRPTG